jgi:hypothetical protein
MSVTHPSDSSAQRAAEPLIVAAVAEYVGLELMAETIDLGDGVQVQIDGASSDRSVLVEAYAHVGPRLSGQSRKLTTDAFKLVWAGRRLGASRLVIAVADVDAEAYLLRPRAWLTAALRDSAVEVLRVSIDAAATARVVEAQRVQFR